MKNFIFSIILLLLLAILVVVGMLVFSAALAKSELPHANFGKRQQIC
jgi:hypothetical protein